MGERKNYFTYMARLRMNISRKDEIRSANGSMNLKSGGTYCGLAMYVWN
jgi:hypothetical protein